MRGAGEDGVAVFRAVPYAAPPIGLLRFEPPAPAAAWTGERDATRHGPIAPQPPSRLRMAMGDFSHPQDEDCLTLTIWTPAVDNTKRPVLIWFHGGAFLSGAGSLPWYSGATMARRGDVVVVGVNYRLGVLGFMHLPGVSPPNLGLRDQFAALEWVSRNIAAFGGDPDNITIAGQSAGGFSVLAMLAVPKMRALFRRAIAQSAPIGRMLRSPAGAAELGRKMQEMLGISSPQQWKEVPAQDIVAAQFKLTVASAQFAGATPPFTPVADGDLFGDELMPAALAGAAERDVMLGHTRDEMAAFFALDQRVKTAPPDLIARRFRDYFGAAAELAIAEYGLRARSTSPEHLLGEMTGDAIFAGGTFDFAERVAAMGRPAHVYRFDWTAPQTSALAPQASASAPQQSASAPVASPNAGAFAACHCCEIPFVFDNFDHWNAPMLAGADPASMRALGDKMQDAWIAFARTGDPSHPGLPPWPRYEVDGRQPVMLFDDDTRVENDPAGRRRWKYWP